MGNFQGRSLDWRLERWETGWLVSLRSCGTAEPVPVMTDGSGFADFCTGPTNPSRCLDPQQWMPRR